MKIYAFSSAVLALALGVGIAPASAQTDQPDSNVPDEPFLSVLYAFEAETDFDDPDVQDAKVEVQEVDFLGTPIYAACEPWQFALSAGFKWTGLEFKNVAEDDLDLYSIILPIDLIYLKEPWMFWANVTPGVFSDLDDVTDEDYQTLASGLVMYTLQPTLRLALGAAYNREFGDDQLYPLGGVIWRIGETWELNLLLPMPRITYAPTSKFLMFADARPAGDMWNVQNDETDTDYDLKIEGYRLGLGMEYELAPHIWLHAAGGLSTGREYELGEGDERLFESEADDTYFVRGGLVVR